MSHVKTGILSVVLLLGMSGFAQAAEVDAFDAAEDPSTDTTSDHCSGVEGVFESCSEEKAGATCVWFVVLGEDLRDRTPRQPVCFM